MPTFEEFRKQLDEEGVKDQAERNRRFGEARRSGILTVPQIPLPALGQEAVPEIGGVTGALHRIGKEAFTRGERKGELLGQVGEAITTSEPFTRGERAGQFLEEITTGRPTEKQPLPPTPAAPAELPAGEGAFVPPPPPPVRPGGGISMPSVPGAEKIEEAIGGFRGELARGEEIARGEKARAVDVLGGQMKALEEQQKVELEKEKAVAGVMRERQANWERLQKEQIDSEQRRKDYSDREFTKVNDAINTLNTSKIDPYRFYKHPDGTADYPKNIAAMLFVGLGAAASALPGQYGGTGGPNEALKILNRGIDRDIAAQRDDIANKRAGVGLQMNLLTQMRQKFGDDRQAENVTRLLMQQSALMKLDEAAAANPEQRTQAKYTGMRAALEGQMHQTFSDITQQTHKESLTGAKELVGMEEKAARAGMTAAQLRGIQAKQAAVARGAAAGPVAFPGARLIAGDYVPSKQDFMKAKPMVAAYNDAAKKLDDLIAWRAQYGQEKLNIKQLGMANKKALRLRSAMRIIDETGARLDPGEIEMMGLDFEMGDIGFVSDYLKVIKESIRTKVSEAIAVRGFELADEPTPGFKKKQ